MLVVWDELWTDVDIGQGWDKKDLKINTGLNP